MITKKIILSLLFLSLLSILLLNGILAYTFQIPLCNPPSINDSCINLTSVPSITNAPSNGIMFWKDGYLYLTNETPVNYTIVYNYTYINVTNITNITTIYNITNGSNFTIIQVQNVTANDSIIYDWINSKFNTTIYNKSDANATFAFKGELNELKNILSSYATKNDLTILDTKYGYLLAINASRINATNFGENNGENFSMTWKVIVIINCVLIVILILFIVKNMMMG